MEIYQTYQTTHVLGIIKRNLLFLHEIEWKNNRFLFTTPNIKFSTNSTEIQFP